MQVGSRQMVTKTSQIANLVQLSNINNLFAGPTFLTDETKDDAYLIATKKAYDYKKMQQKSENLHKWAC